MKNQLLLIADLPTESDSARTTTRPTKSAADELLGSKTGGQSGSPRNVDRAHKGVDAARKALRDAVQRATALEQQRREAREAALLAAITQPHLPHMGGTPGRRAA